MKAPKLDGACPTCAANLALVGRVHRCVLRVTAAPVAAGTHAVGIQSEGTHAAGVAGKRARWRKAHPEQHAAQQRAYRARKKAAT